MKWLKIGGVIFGAVAITALGIDAADTLQGSRATLLGQLVSTETAVCPEGMVELAAATSFSCVDIYEASPDNDCPARNPVNIFDTQKNLADAECRATSKAKAAAWVYVTREDAQTACVRAGKRLPTNEEWQLFAAGTPDTKEVCVADESSADVTGSRSACISASGVFDAVGNVWEWTHDDVFDGEYNGRPLPSEGYVLQVDRGGIATVSGTSSSALFGEDYFWAKPEGVYAIMRGGFYGSREDAGVYTAHAATPPTVTGQAIGFRCVM